MENEQAILSFMELTNVGSVEEAKQYLESSGNILEVAIQNFYDSNQSSFPAQEPANPVQFVDETEEDEVRPALPREYSQLVEDESIRSVQLNRVKRQFASSFRDLKREMEIQENLASGIAPKRKCLEDIYRNPIDITVNLDLHSARVVGQRQGKWIALLINDESFQSLSFNRDIFNNDTTDKVKQIIKKNFLFLRKNSSGEESLKILHNYNLSHQAIPIFLIIDSLTGELRKNFGDTQKLTLRSVVKELKKYTSSLDNQLHYNSDVASDEDLSNPFSNFGASSSSFTASRSSTATSNKPHSETKPTVVESESEESFASLSSDEDEKCDIAEPKVLDSDDDLLNSKEEKQTSIMLKMQDTNESFKYPSSRTVQQLISYIYRNYLVQTGMYRDGRNRFTLFSKVHNKCITTLEQSHSLEQSNISPSCVLHHNTVEKE